jgi:hypothetical protein
VPERPQMAPWTGRRPGTLQVQETRVWHNSPTDLQGKTTCAINAIHVEEGHGTVIIGVKQGFRVP